MVLFIALFLKFSRCDEDRKINCSTEFHTLTDINTSDEWRFVCPNACTDQPGEVYGTVLYSLSSSICKSALHDLRISRRNDSTYEIIFKKKNSTERFESEGSFRQMIQSKTPFPSKLFFYFTNPRVSENLLDIISLHHNYLNDGKNHIQECRIPTSYMNQKVFFTEGKNIWKPFSSDQIDGNPSYLRFYKNWNNISTDTGFWCRTNFNSLSDIFSISTNVATSFSQSITVTTNLGDTANIFQLLNLDSSAGTSEELKKDGKKISIQKYNNNRSINISDVGLYKQASKLSRLIVRVCERGKYGPECNETCPDCLNGGICHDILGVCLCPPGFNGTFCENECPRNYFGKYCNQRCYSESGLVKQCSKILFCLPDPYGCSCYTGYKHPYCNQTCDSGWYGSNCLQKCPENCNITCDPFSGLCVHGCQPGWHSKKCLLSYPVLKSLPKVVNISSDHIVLNFKPWTAENNFGNGTPIAYYIQFKKSNNQYDNFKYIGEPILHEESNTFYITTVRNLSAETEYIFRIVVRDKSGSAQFNGIPEITAKTLCSIPSSPPINVNLTSPESRKIMIQWKIPTLRKGECKPSRVILRYENQTSKIYEKELRKKTSDTFDTKPYTKWIVKLRFKYKNERYSSWSEEKSGYSQQDAPSRVRNLQYRIENRSPFYGSNNPTLLLWWDKPEEENGIIVNYHIQYFQDGWRHNCTEVKKQITFSYVKNESYKYTFALRYSAIYKFNVYAVTVKPGLPSEITAYTNESVPSNSPVNLTVVNMNPRNISLTWSPPNCSYSNGMITKYKLRILSEDIWDQSNFTQIVQENYFTFTNLIPYTNYKISVVAGTNIGFSNFSQVITIQTSSEKPPAPTNLTIYQKTESSLSVAWKSPFPPYGNLTTYRISYKCVSKECTDKNNKTFYHDIGNITCDEDEKRDEYHCYILVGLEAMKSYNIEIRAINDQNHTGNAATINGETKESVPDPPQNAYLVNSTEYSFNISWELPKKKNGILKNYRVNITAVKSFNETITGTDSYCIVNYTPIYCNFEDLYPATLYNISIEASTSAGYGSPLYIQFTTRHSVPVIDEEPKVLDVTDTTIDLAIKPLKFDKGPISEYHIIVQLKSKLNKREIKLPDIELVNYNASREQDLNYYSSGRLTPDDVGSNGINFTVGDGKFYNSYYNAPLQTGQHYQLGVAVLSTYYNETHTGYKYLSNVVKVERKVDKKVNTGSLIGVLFGIIGFLIIIIVLISYSRKRNLIGKFKKETNFKMKNLNKENDNELIVSSTNTLEENPVKEITVEEPTTCIPVSKLDEYVLDSLQTGELKKQFLSIKKGQCTSWIISKKPENKPKNRYGNLLAYDETRVILQIHQNNPHSDYINANYVDGFRKPRNYIATQGPKQLTICDFWRMICQENVCKIIMVTNLVENGKTKCEKYWPDSSENYGNINISLIDKEMYSDYVIRNFCITADGKMWTLKHFHYTAWPDHGVPMFTTSVVAFLQRVRNFNPSYNSPIVVHCSAGVGRTGTVILLDSMMDMAHSEKCVDLVSHLTLMRKQRINIVENLEQYCFVYQALADYLCGFETSVLCSEYHQEIKKLSKVCSHTGKTGFLMQFERLQKLRRKIKPADCRSAFDTENQSKNRNLDVVPPEAARVILKGDVSLGTYINAVHIDGYKRKDYFIVTQVPLPETVSDFWRMMFFETNTFILLNDLDEDYPSYWPHFNEMTSYENMQVSNIAEEVQEGIVIRTFTVKNLSTKDDSKIVKQFHFTGWKSNSCLPESDENILHLIEKVERWQKQTGSTVVVQCFDGVRACGIYCACVFICDKIKDEQEVDVFLAARSIRANRPNFIENLEQYIFCFKVACCYLESFQIYANFQ